MQVLFSPRALRDLAAIGDFIATDNARRAATFVVEIETACATLATESLRYPLLERPAGYRRMPFGNFLILYQATEDEVRIVRILHAARDWRDVEL